jgi:LmbE family N-acetylglucosaminyl deacetylase
MNPYAHLVSEYVRFAREGKSYPLGGFATPPRTPAAPGAPKVLLFSPHPDDECIVGGLALRLQRQAGMRVINVAVTQGSNPARQAGRWLELENACRFLGFELVATRANGLEKVNPKTRQHDPAAWQVMVAIIANLLQTHQPRVLFFPHDQDWNSTHLGAHFLVMDALRSLGPGCDCFLVETEFWGQMQTPNLMVESAPEDVAEMMTATSFHVGEVKRNPYHLLQPAWMQDNVRRGGELVGGQGQAAPDFVFATIYRLRRWRGGQAELVYPGGKLLPASADPAGLFA